jgi:uncharacterized membrane protein YdcZ (DUF606 family)
MAVIAIFIVGIMIVAVLIDHGRRVVRPNQRVGSTSNIGLVTVG